MIFGVFAILLVGGVGYYTLSPLFLTLKGNEALPMEAKKEMQKTSMMESEKQMMAQHPKMEQKMEPKKAAVLGTPGHPASGLAYVVSANGKQYLRYEDLKTINGPDIYVYLAKDLDAKDYIDLGRVRVTEGSVNYEIPEGVRVEDYPYALTWCKMFGVLFNSAQIGG